MMLSWELRTAFAVRMAAVYGREVPAYTTLVDVASSVNALVSALDGESAERLGSIERVTAERHGAIRVGTPSEMRSVAAIFAALGMHPVGFYDLRDAARSSVPVVSTAFRPTGAVELERNPFRMFTSMLVTDDRRFFSPDLQARLDAFLARRTLFPPELLSLASRAAAEGGLPGEEAEVFLKLAVDAFTLSSEPVDAAWYAELEAVSAVAADIGGVSSTHINHLTPRVLDIDDLYRRMSARGIEMIDAIQGPPRWEGPDVLLRQTSFRALAEPRRFHTASGDVIDGSLRVRFGEVEARGVALTSAGRDRYDALSGQDAAAWSSAMPPTELGLLREGLSYFTFRPTGRAAARTGTLAEQVFDGVLAAMPIVYEDFLPRSAAGIFQSNLTDEGTRDDSAAASRRDSGWLSDVIGSQVADPYVLYAAQQAASVAALPARIRAALT
ncbi:MAG: 2-oxoadipate dioxygenase/decarboxylase [Jatrophihabitantaceae bacterium]